MGTVQKSRETRSTGELNISGYAKKFPDGINAVFLSSGCKLNRFESFQFEEILRKENPGVKINVLEPALTASEKHNKVHLFFLNTCSVTEKANTEANKIIRRIHRRYPDSLLILTGCSVQLNSIELPEHENVKLVDNLTKTKLLEQASASSPDTLTEQKKTRPYLKIQEGCNIRCSFCIIPDARPSIWSMKKNDIIDAIKRFEDKGFKEVVLTGVNIGSFGSEYSSSHKLSVNTPRNSMGLKNLLKAISLLDTGIKIRISSIDPLYIDDDLIDIISDCRNIQNHFHIPLQSGSDKILRLMNRNYDFKFYASIVEKMVHRINNVAIGTDIINGFPSETHDDFTLTCKNINELPLYYIHSFSYSERKKTPSCLIFPKVDGKTIKERTAAVREISDRKKKKFHKQNENLLLEFLSLNDGYAISSNYIKARLDKDRLFNLKQGSLFTGKLKKNSGTVPSVEFVSMVNV